MSVIGRLWRRAPAWRMCAAVAVACTALAAMFPPDLLFSAPSRAMLPRWAGGSGSVAAGNGAGTPVAGQAGPTGAARFVPQPVPTVPGVTSIDLPPLAPGREALMPVAGRLLPLPAGSWQLVAFGRVDGARAIQVLMLDRVEAGRLTGLLLVAAQAPLAVGGGPVTVPLACVAPDTLAHQIVAPAQEGSTSDLAAHECWTVSASDMAGLATSGDMLMRRSLERLGKMRVAVPDHMLAVRVLRSDRTGWMLATVFLPDRRAGAEGTLHRVEEWAGRFTRLFHRGYDGALVAGDVTAGRGAEE